MKKTTQAQQQLHLVTPEEAAAGAQPLSPREEDAFLVKDIRRYQQLQREFEQELFGKRDVQKLLAEILPELQLVRERLAAHDIHISL